MNQENIHFVTGTLAESALRDVVASLSRELGFEYSIQVLPITVAALLTPRWIAARIDVPSKATRVILPGYAAGDLELVKERCGIPVELGPRDLRRLPEHFGQSVAPPSLEMHDIEIIAEINHAPRMELSQIIAAAKTLQRDGADLIDIGCDPGMVWHGVGDCVAALVDQGLRVSIDSLNRTEIALAARAGAELVLSVDYSNREAAADWGIEVVVIPDDPRDWHSMETTMEWLQQKQVPFRIDPILEPVGFGFAASLERYMQSRRRWSDCEMMMGVGNLTEMSDVDSAGINFLLLAICGELKIRSVLTTQVINWARSSVRECDLARRLVFHSIENQVPPKRVSDDLVCLRDAKLLEFGMAHIERIAELIRDYNYRIMAENGEVHVLGRGQHFHGTDPFQLFDQLLESSPRPVDASHAFYLGYEMCKAMVASQLGKQYTQDEALDWGHLTVTEEVRHRLTQRAERRDGE